MANVRYYFEPDGKFIIEDYNHSKPFSSFLPGIAGEKGIPIWAFYVNRGQCLAGFGIGNKDGAIQEFVPADKAPWYTAWRGFRTFIKLQQEKNSILYEPFRISNEHHWKIQAKLGITAAEIELTEINHDLGIEVRINYFTLPGAKIGGLFRKTEIMNHKQETLQLQLIDGMAVILPVGFTNYLAKNMGATIRAWMSVSTKSGVPFYKLAFQPDDLPELYPVSSGNFFLGYTVQEDKIRQLKPIYDPVQIFGRGSDFQPVVFEAPHFGYPQNQAKENYLPAAMSYYEGDLPAGGNISLFGLYGQVPEEDFLTHLLPEVDAQYYDGKRLINCNLIQSITDHAFTSSGQPMFDQYMGQSFLDNTIRGGLPITLTGNKGKNSKVFWLYSRKHGDLERDYNDFQLSPTYYSQGNGNFRDINQNRRNDVWFNSDVGDAALRYFWNLIQLDGYNPLVVKGSTYSFDDLNIVAELLPNDLSIHGRRKILEFISKAFTPGELVELIEELSVDTLRSDLFAILMEEARELENAEPYPEGYWTDHWIYNLDLLESFFSIYPDRIKEVCFDRKDYTFYDNWTVLEPVDQRYYLVNGEVRLKNCIRGDTAKKQWITGRKGDHHLVRAGQGNGEVYRTNLIVKMIILALNKLASFDPLVTGLEMDAGKPGWCDALNGLPGIMGSSTVEVFAVKRLLDQMDMILGIISPFEVIAFPVEVKNFISGLIGILESVPETKHEKYRFWEKIHRLRDQYIQAIGLGLSGQEQNIRITELFDLIQKSHVIVGKALDQAYQPENGLYSTYFYYKVVRWKVLEGVGAAFESGDKASEIRIWPEEFEQHPLPHFLEGQVHALRGELNRHKAQSLYQSVRNSDLYDQKLKMYKVCANLSGAPQELGRIRVFPRGWLENESIFLHMEYKYLLEIFRQGLYEEFFSELTDGLVCFLKPEVYGRSPLENSSFLVTGVYPEPEFHGNGFVARLSGSTAEMIHIWLFMSFGVHPFQLDESGELGLEFAPVLNPLFFSTSVKQVEFFGENGVKKSYLIPSGSYAAKFLGKTLVVYQNPLRKETFGIHAAKVRTIMLFMWNGEKIEVEGAKITGKLVERIRDGQAERIDVYLE